jgi:hypothetical protein
MGLRWTVDGEGCYCILILYAPILDYNKFPRWRQPTKLNCYSESASAPFFLPLTRYHLCEFDDTSAKPQPTTRGDEDFF